MSNSGFFFRILDIISSWVRVTRVCQESEDEESRADFDITVLSVPTANRDGCCNSGHPTFSRQGLGLSSVSAVDPYTSVVANPQLKEFHTFQSLKVFLVDGVGLDVLQEQRLPDEH